MAFLCMISPDQFGLISMAVIVMGKLYRHSWPANEDYRDLEIKSI